MWCAVWAWVTESANLLLDLANSGRDAGNAFVLAIAAGLAIIRVAAFLILIVPAAAWIFEKIQRETTRAVAIFLIVVTVVFEIWASPTRKTDAPESAPETEIAESAEGGYDGM